MYLSLSLSVCLSVSVYAPAVFLSVGPDRFCLKLHFLALRIKASFVFFSNYIPSAAFVVDFTVY